MLDIEFQLHAEYPPERHGADLKTANYFRRLKILFAENFICAKTRQSSSTDANGKMWLALKSRTVVRISLPPHIVSRISIIYSLLYWKRFRDNAALRCETLNAARKQIYFYDCSVARIREKYCKYENHFHKTWVLDKEAFERILDFCCYTFSRIKLAHDYRWILQIEEL